MKYEIRCIRSDFGPYVCCKQVVYSKEEMDTFVRKYLGAVPDGISATVTVYNPDEVPALRVIRRDIDGTTLVR